MSAPYGIRDYIAFLQLMADGGWDGRIEHSGGTTMGVTEDEYHFRASLKRPVKVAQARPAYDLAREAARLTDERRAELGLDRV